MVNFKGLENKFKNLNSMSVPAEGRWTQIRWTPDLVANEQIAIGILLESNGIIHTKFIDDFGRLKCVYGEDIEEHIELAIDLIEYTLKRNYKKSISPQILFDERGFARGDSYTHILENLFERAIPFGKPHGKIEQIERFPTLRTQTLISRIKADIIHHNKVNVINIFPEDSLVKVFNKNETHQIEIPIRPINSQQLATINSTIYRTFDKFENNCLTAMNNLQVAKKCNFGNEAILYNLLPTTEQFSLLSEPEQEKRYKFLDELKWNLDLYEIEHRPFYTESEMSSDILAWANPRVSPESTLFE